MKSFFSKLVIDLEWSNGWIGLGNVSEFEPKTPAAIIAPSIAVIPKARIILFFFASAFKPISFANGRNYENGTIIWNLRRNAKQVYSGDLESHPGSDSYFTLNKTLRSIQEIRLS